MPHAGAIGLVHRVLAARPAMRLLPRWLSTPGYRVEHRTAGGGTRQCSLSRCESRVDQGEPHEARTVGEIGDDPSRCGGCAHGQNGAGRRPPRTCADAALAIISASRRLNPTAVQWIRGIGVTVALWRTAGINHGREPGTSAGGDSMPAAGARPARLWTGPMACRQARDSGDNQWLTRIHRESRGRGIWQGREKSGRAPLSPVSTGPSYSIIYLEISLNWIEPSGLLLDTLGPPERRVPCGYAPCGCYLPVSRAQGEKGGSLSWSTIPPPRPKSRCSRSAGRVRWRDPVLRLLIPLCDGAGSAFLAGEVRHLCPGLPMPRWMPPGGA